MNHVQYVTTHRSATLHDIADKYEFRSDKGYRVLQRFLFFILRLIGAYAQEKDVSISHFAIDTESFMDRLMQQHGDLLYEHNFYPELILMGATDYQRMMGDKEMQYLVRFNTQYSVKCSRYSGVEIYGMRVVVVPWMEGIVVMPKTQEWL